MMQKEEMIVKDGTNETIRQLQKEEKTMNSAVFKTDKSAVSDKGKEEAVMAPTEISVESLENIKYIEEGTFEVNYVDEEHEEELNNDEYNALDSSRKEEALRMADSMGQKNSILEETVGSSAGGSSASINDRRAVQITPEYMSTLSVVQRNIIKMEMEISRQTKAAEEQWVPRREILKEDFIYIPVKGGHWVKSEPKQNKKKSNFFTKLFQCMNPFSK
ncbi:hypothetical protein NEMIN01_0455 [Nematocida minor]|uniref:uncharacterized protein n=1 Tax=Nematocida minor TaxID=1912983 RepID=UPI00221EED37|nr:uncharacterized protein NEMIN01_0455 [Nematocida minor]KAI5189392.1 hypothetical protein NEMIN01_0455 [Nematocida minor]